MINSLYAECASILQEFGMICMVFVSNKSSEFITWVESMIRMPTQLPQSISLVETDLLERMFCVVASSLLR